MSEKVLCARQDACPVVLAACERKVMAESSARLAEANLANLKAEYDRKRPLMNELYAAGVSMRKAQRDYFKDRTQANLVKSKVAEVHFDKALAACATVWKPTQPTLI